MAPQVVKQRMEEQQRKAGEEPRPMAADGRTAKAAHRRAALGQRPHRPPRERKSGHACNDGRSRQAHQASEQAEGGLGSKPRGHQGNGQGTSRPTGDAGICSPVVFFSPPASQPDEPDSGASALPRTSSASGNAHRLHRRLQEHARSASRPTAHQSQRLCTGS